MNSQIINRIGALGGIIMVVLQIGGQMLIQVGGQEPAFNASTMEIVDFFSNRNPQLATWGSFLNLLAFIPFLWFLGVLWQKLRQSEQGEGWLSVVALGSGILIIAIQAISGAGWTTAFVRFGDNNVAELTRFQFDFGNFLFSVSWVMMASLLLATGILSITQKALPRWTGWFGLLTTVALLIASAGWFSASGLIFFPVMLYWVWLIIVSVVLYRTPPRSVSQAQ